MSKKDLAFLYGTNFRVQIKETFVMVLNTEVAINIRLKRLPYSLFLILGLYKGTAVLLRNAP